MTRSLVEYAPNANETGVFKAISEDEVQGGLFANLVSVTFSAFDPFGPLSETQEAPNRIGYSYIGLKPESDGSSSKPQPPKTIEQLTQEFFKSVLACRTGVRGERWRTALETLEADPLFKEGGCKPVVGVRRRGSERSCHKII